MPYLICAIFCGASINLGFALAGRKGLDSLNTTLLNYVAACGVSAVSFALKMRSGEITRAFSGSVTVPLALSATESGFMGLASTLIAERLVTLALCAYTW